jgi:small-conductance mechanosensitive channel
MQTFLNHEILGNMARSWLLAVLTAAAVYVGLLVVRRLLLRNLGALARRTANEIDDLLQRVLEHTKVFFLLFVSLYAGSRVLYLPSDLAQALRFIGVIIVVVQAAVWGNVIITAVVSRQIERRIADDASSAMTLNALGFIGRLALWVLLLLLALENLGIDVTALVTGLGIGGIAVALALQNILGDLFASLSIVLDKPFVLGDFIIVDDKLGTVEHIGLKTTRVRSLSGEQLVFSNSDLLSARIRNFKRMYERRIVFTLGVTYDTPRAQLERIPTMIREAVEAQQNARFDRSHFAAYGDFSINFETVYYVLVPDYNTYMDIQQAINLEVHRRFAEAGIQFAFPTQTLHLVRAEP